MDPNERIYVALTAGGHTFPLRFAPFPGHVHPDRSHGPWQQYDLKCGATFYYCISCGCHLSMSPSEDLLANCYDLAMRKMNRM